MVTLDASNKLLSRIAPVSKESLAEYCRHWLVAELALFGSVLRDDFGPESDVDVLVVYAARQK